MLRRIPWLGGLLLWAVACGDDGVTVDVNGDPPQLLSSFNLLSWDGSTITYHDSAIPYDLNTALFSDYALKSRAIYVPPGTSAEYRNSGSFTFPEGTAIVKSFLFPASFSKPTENLRLVETRVLLMTASGWKAYPYLWNSEGTDAELKVGGSVEEITFVDPHGVTRTANYLVPQRNQCASCHERLDAQGKTYIDSIGPTARNLNRLNPSGTENQLTEWSDRGYLTGLPELSSVPAALRFEDLDFTQINSMSLAELEPYARDYLDVNCAHCHNPRAVNGITSQLFLNWDNTNNFNLGVCKQPGSAGTGTGGLAYDIVPGDPNNSILHFRVVTEQVGAMMPLLGRSVTHTEGAELIRAWIAAMPAQTCQ